ncbi:MAG: stalk domain-containing protein [Bacillota bacterium]
MRKMSLISILTILLLIGTAVTAKEVYRRENVVAIYQDFKIIINGKLLSSAVEPFQLENGSVMVPVRAMSEALGYDVEWDPSTKTVYLRGDSRFDEGAAYNPSYLEDLPVLRNVGPFYNLQSRKIIIAGRQFERGLIVELAPGERDIENEGVKVAEAVVDLKGEFTRLEGYLGVDDETRNSRAGYSLTILADGLPIYEAKEVKPSEYPFNFSLNVAKTNRLTIRIKWLEGDIGDDDRLVAALANWVCY